MYDRKTKDRKKTFGSYYQGLPETRWIHIQQAGYNKAPETLVRNYLIFNFLIYARRRQTH